MHHVRTRCEAAWPFKGAAIATPSPRHASGQSALCRLLAQTANQAAMLHQMPTFMAALNGQPESPSVADSLIMITFDAVAQRLCTRQHRARLCVLDSWESTKLGALLLSAASALRPSDSTLLPSVLSEGACMQDHPTVLFPKLMSPAGRLTQTDSAASFVARFLFAGWADTSC